MIRYDLLASSRLTNNQLPGFTITKKEWDIHQKLRVGSSVVIAIYILFFLPQNIHAKVPKFAWHLNSGRNYSKNVNHFCCYNQPSHSLTDPSNHSNIRTSPVTAKVSTIYHYLLILSLMCAKVPIFCQMSGKWNDRIMANWLKMNLHSCSCFLLLFYFVLFLLF